MTLMTQIPRTPLRNRDLSAGARFGRTALILSTLAQIRPKLLQTKPTLHAARNAGPRNQREKLFREMNNCSPKRIAMNRWPYPFAEARLQPHRG